MALLTRTNKTTDKQVQPPPAAPAPVDELTRLTQQSAELESEIQRLTETLAPIDELAAAMTKRAAITAQLGIARHLAWQSRVNGIMQRRVAAKAEYEQLSPQREDNSRQDEAARNELWSAYSWDGKGGATPEWLERRIELMAQIERHKFAHIRLSSRISELSDVMKDCDELLASYHRLGDAALTAGWHDLHPGRIAAGPDGIYSNGVFTPAPPPTPIEAPEGYTITRNSLGLLVYTRADGTAGADDNDSDGAEWTAKA
ncbi:MAG: hypothetical protein M5U05_19570 [Anaerolineales bacterium]|nr:hypothetical protein [Anaerolineales bacterium]